MNMFMEEVMKRVDEVEENDRVEVKMRDGVVRGEG